MAEPRGTTEHRTIDHVAQGLALAACAWAALLVLLAVVLPIRTTDDGTIGPQPRHTLFHDFGAGVLAPSAGPLLVCVVVLLLLRSGEATPLARVGAWVLSLAVLIGALVGFVTFIIGIFVMPSAVLLVTACAASRPSASSS